MAKVDALTGVSTSRGHKKKHRRGSSGGSGVWRFKAPKTNRSWEPNLRKVRVIIEGKTQTIKVSMKTYNKLRTEGSFRGATLISKVKINAASKSASTRVAK